MSDDLTPEFLKHRENFLNALSEEIVDLPNRDEFLNRPITTVAQAAGWPVNFRDAKVGDLADTFERADGELIGGEFGWVSDVEYFDDDGPTKLVRKRWQLIEVEELTVNEEES